MAHIYDGKIAEDVYAAAVRFAADARAIDVTPRYLEIIQTAE